MNSVFAQSGQQNLFTTVKPEATIKIQKHSMGADLVEITLLDAKYPPEALRDQINRLGVELHCQPRGLALSQLSMSPGDSGGAFLRANFAVDGLADQTTGEYRIGPLARAMAGGPPGHEIHGLAIIFQNLVPGAATLEQFGLQPGSPVSVQGRYEPGPIGLEYRVALNNQDPSKIVIPDTKSPPTGNPAYPAQDTVQKPWLLYASLMFFAVAIGALVYSLTLRNSGPRPPSASRKTNIGTSRHR